MLQPLWSWAFPPWPFWLVLSTWGSLFKLSCLAFCWGWDGARLTAWKFFVWPLTLEVSVCASEGASCHNAPSWNEFFATVASSSIDSSSSFLSLQNSTFVSSEATRHLCKGVWREPRCLPTLQGIYSGLHSTHPPLLPQSTPASSSVNCRSSERHWHHSVHKSDSHAMVSVQGMACAMSCHSQGRENPALLELPVEQRCPWLSGSQLCLLPLVMVVCEDVKSVIWQVTCVHAWLLLKVSNIAGGSEISHGATGAAGTRRVS